MEFEFVGWPADGPTIRLDHRTFSYAGKFVMSNTGKAVVRRSGRIVAAASFNCDRTDDRTMWIRYVTVHSDHRGEGIGPALLDFVAERLHSAGFERVKIAVNNPFAYQAAYRAGFAFTGEETGLAELVLVRPGDRSTEQYRDGIDRFTTRPDLSDEEQEYIETARWSSTPSRIRPSDST